VSDTGDVLITIVQGLRPSSSSSSAVQGSHPPVQAFGRCQRNHTSFSRDRQRQTKRSPPKRVTDSPYISRSVIRESGR
jgi:hypothetical protein